MAVCMTIAAGAKLMFPQVGDGQSGSFVAAIEVMLALSLLLLRSRTWPIVATLLAIFAAVVYTLWTGRDSCGCFGRLWNPSIGQRLIWLATAGLATSVLWCMKLGLRRGGGDE